MKVTIIKVVAVVIGTLGMIQRNLVKRLQGLEIRGGFGTIQMMSLLKTMRKLRRVLKCLGNLVFFNFHCRPSVMTGVNLQ